MIWVSAYKVNSNSNLFAVSENRAAAFGIDAMARYNAPPERPRGQHKPVKGVRRIWSIQ
jgi:hypothetical protein